MGSSVCHECGAEFIAGSTFAYCPACGAKMRSDKEIALDNFREQLKDLMQDRWFKDLDKKFECCFTIDELYEEFVKKLR